MVDNTIDYMLGNVYVRYRHEEAASKALVGLTGRYYFGKLISAEYSPVADFREARCRAHHETRCSRVGSCRFLHINHIPKALKRRVARQMYKEHPEFLRRGRDIINAGDRLVARMNLEDRPDRPNKIRHEGRGGGPLAIADGRGGGAKGGGRKSRGGYEELQGGPPGRGPYEEYYDSGRRGRPGEADRPRGRHPTAEEAEIYNPEAQFVEGEEEQQLENGERQPLRRRRKDPEGDEYRVNGRRYEEDRDGGRGYYDDAQMDDEESEIDDEEL